VSPLRGEKPQNWPLSKLNTGRFALRAMLPVMNTTSATTGARFSKRNGRKGQTASVCQILWQQVQSSPRYGDFSIFQDGGHLGFLKFEILTVRRLNWPNCVDMPNLVEIGQNAAEIWPFFDFSRWRQPPYWIFKI